MSSTPRSGDAQSSPSQAIGRSRARSRRAAGLAVAAALTVLGPGAYGVSAIVTAPSAIAASSHKHKKPKHKCKKGFVYQHGKCVASSRPVY